MNSPIWLISNTVLGSVNAALYIAGSGHWLNLLAAILCSVAVVLQLAVSS